MAGPPTYTFWCTKTYTGPWWTYRFTHTQPGYTVTTTHSFLGSTSTFTVSDPGYTTTLTRIDLPPESPLYGTWDLCTVDNTPTIAWAIPLGLILGLYALGFIVAAIFYFWRQKKRKAWYGPMAAYYKGGLPHDVKE